MQRDVRAVLRVVNERYPSLRRRVRFTFWIRLTNRSGGDERWEVNFWRRSIRRSRAAKPRVEIIIPRSHFWALVEHSSRHLWRDAFDNGNIGFDGNAKYAKRLQAKFLSLTR